MNISIESHHFDIIKEIIKIYPYSFFVFGSRAKNSAHKFSDLDLCVMEDVADNIVFNLEEEFRESNLPFKVELIQWHKISKDFQQKIQKDLVALPK